jgi:hypothetical protein
MIFSIIHILRTHNPCKVLNIIFDILIEVIVYYNQIIIIIIIFSDWVLRMQDIKKWVIEYIKHRDVLEKSLKEIEEIGPGELLIIKFDANIHCIINDDMETAISLIPDKDQNSILVVPNKKKNLKSLMKNWNSLSQYKMLKIIFVNPDSSTDKRWIIIPYIHNRISDSNTLSRGLKTLFESVEELN